MNNTRTVARTDPRPARLGLLFAGLALLAGCGDRASTAATDPGAVLNAVQTIDLHDGSTPQGNPHFRFLPPLARAPSSFAGVFDGGLDPVVLVCRLGQSACIAGSEQQFTGRSSGSQRLRVVPEDEHYVVNWLVPAGSGDQPEFRVAVWVAGVSLGHIDVLVKEGQTIPIKFRVEVGALSLAPIRIGADVPAATRERLVTVASLVASVGIGSNSIRLPLPGVPGIVSAQDATGQSFLLGYAAAPNGSTVQAAPPNADVGQLDARSTAFVMVRAGLIVVGDASDQFDADILAHSSFDALVSRVQASLQAGTSPISDPATWDAAVAISAGVLPGPESGAASPFRPQGVVATEPVPVGTTGRLEPTIDLYRLVFSNESFIYLNVENRDRATTLIGTAEAPPRNFCVICWPPFGASESGFQATEGLNFITTSGVGGSAGQLNFGRAVSIALNGVLTLAGLEAPTGSEVPALISYLIQLDLIERIAEGGPGDALQLIVDAIFSQQAAKLLERIVEAAVGENASNWGWYRFVAGQLPAHKVVSALLLTAEAGTFIESYVRDGALQRTTVCVKGGTLHAGTDGCEAIRISCGGSIIGLDDAVGFPWPGSRIRCYALLANTDEQVAALWRSSNPTKVSIENAPEGGLGVDLVTHAKGLVTVTAQSVDRFGADDISVYAVDFSGLWVTNTGEPVLRLTQSGSRVFGAYYREGEAFAVEGTARADCSGCYSLNAAITPSLIANGASRSLLQVFLNPPSLGPGSIILLDQFDQPWFSNSLGSLYAGHCSTSYLTALLETPGPVGASWIPCIFNAEPPPALRGPP